VAGQLRIAVLVGGLLLLPAVSSAQLPQFRAELLNDYAACLKRDAEACYRVGQHYLPYIDEEPGDFTRAAHFFLLGCDAGEPRLCARVGEMHERGEGFKADLTRASELYARACKESDPEGCLRLAMLDERGVGGTADLSRAATSYERACALEEAFCRWFAPTLQQGRGIARDPARALAIYERACGQSDWSACYEAGLAYRGGVGVTRDEAAALKLFRGGCAVESLGCSEACDAGDAAACKKHADQLDTGEGGVRPDPVRANQRYERAVALFEAACARNEPTACDGLLNLYRSVRPLTINDRALALRFYTRVCEARAREGCYTAAGLFERAVPADLPRAASLYAEGCDAGHLESCERAAEMFRTGRGVPRDPARAAFYAAQAAEIRRYRR